MNSQKNILTITLCIALTIISCTYILLSTAGDGVQSLAEPDTLLYLQYAKNLAQGNPYVFTEGDSPSTGSTTHLLPYLLAGLYRLGATGTAFVVAGFILNSFFYLGILTLFWLITRKWYPEGQWLVMLMLVLSGHLASAVLRQTDIGLFTLLTTATFACLVYGRKLLTLLLVILCAITRPEGFVISIALILCGCWGFIAKNQAEKENEQTNEQARLFLFYGMVGSTVFGLVLVLNYALTGTFQFMSVMNKGYFKIYPMAGAIDHTLSDAILIVKGALLGLNPGMRQYYFLPVMGGFLGIAGALLFARRERRIRLCEGWLWLSFSASILLIASSRFQGVSNDRYLGWILPFWMVYITIGVYELHKRVKARFFMPICATLLIGYQALSLTYFATDAYAVAVELEKEKDFTEQIRNTIPAEQNFGSTAGSSLSFWLPNYRVYNLSGITSPDFFHPQSRQQSCRIIDQIKHHPELRFDNWLLLMSDQTQWIQPFIGERVLLDMDSALASTLTYVIYKAKWDTLDGGSVPMSSTLQINERKLVDALDVGYLQDEASHDYRCITRLKNTNIPMIATTTKLGEKDYSESGRIVIGSETFKPNNLFPDKSLLIVLRTSSTAEGLIFLGKQSSRIENLQFKDTLSLRVFVEGNELYVPPLEICEEGFSEVTIEIPANYIQNESPKITIIGDHISYAYWFYQ